MALPQFQPMLASSGPIAAPEDDWAFEPKLDGWRALVSLDDTLDVHTRSGRDVTAAVPELNLLTEALSGRSCVLDGELIVGQGRGLDFYGLAPRLAASSVPRRRHVLSAVAFVAFDVLYLDGELCTGLTYADRRELLEQLCFDGPSWSTMPSYPGMGRALFVSCAGLQLEGVVAKRLAASYQVGKRSPDWVKAKTPDWLFHHAPRRRPNRPANRPDVELAV